MLYAKIDGQKVKATPAVRRGSCPVCNGAVIAKCSEKRLKIWHWAHVRRDCDAWSEPETAWHRNWKELFPIECREVPMQNHRCDIKAPNCVIELQHSYLAPEEIEEREAFYGEMIWIFDLRKIEGAIRRGSLATGQFLWPRFRAAMAYCCRPVFIHLGRSELLNIWDYDPRIRFGLYRRFSKDEFLAAVGFPPASGLVRVPAHPFTIVRSTGHVVEWNDSDPIAQVWAKRKAPEPTPPVVDHR